MLDKQGEIIPPYVFLLPTERDKLMHKIDHLVMHNSMQQMASIQEQLGCLNINLSGQTIAHADCYEIIVSAIKRSAM
jgi:EAL domain-containing protein (putative c-di-GMP-specific phosphodiesterase class I)